jgi:hypothetical protein
MEIVPFYEAARSAGLLTLVTVGSVSVHCAFRAPDDTVLDGLAISRDYQIEYPGAWLTLAPGDQLTIGAASYQVREVRAVGDGTERRASLSRL